MGLEAVQDVPREAEHDPDQDQRMPDGRLIQQFTTDDGRVFTRVTKKGEPTRCFRLDPDAVTS